MSNVRKERDTDVLLESLQIEQKRLNKKSEELLRVLDHRTQEISKKLKSAEKKGVSLEALQEIESEQEVVWLLLRRLQAAMRGTRELETEHKEWTGRETGGLHRLHPDHPSMRAEIIASELRSRGKFVDSVQPRTSFHGSAEDVIPSIERPVEEVHVISSEEDVPAPAKIRYDADVIIDEIQYCMREMDRMLAHPDRDELQGELVDFGKQLKYLHGLLRLEDRADGRRRARHAF